MNRRDFLHGVVALTGAMTVGECGARAQQTRRDLRLVFARGGELFACPGMDGTDARPVLTVGTNDSWSVSPDGRRIAWMVQAEAAKSAGPETQGLSARPATIYLSDMLGRHQKILLTTADLRDRQGRSVKKTGVPDANDFDAWYPVSVGWSADGRTVYIGCVSKNSNATYAADAVSGAALVDGDGNWKLLAPLSYIDAQGGLLVGLAPRPVRPLPESHGFPDNPFGGIVVVNLAEGGARVPQFHPIKPNDDAPPPAWESAQPPVLGPDHRSIAYASGAYVSGGLWVRDRYSKLDTPSRQIANVQAEKRPQWTSDGKQVFFLQFRAEGRETAKTDVYDLYQVNVPVKTTDPPGEPHLVLQNVDSFALAPQ